MLYCTVACGIDLFSRSKWHGTEACEADFFLSGSYGYFACGIDLFPMIMFLCAELIFFRMIIALRCGGLICFPMIMLLNAVLICLRRIILLYAVLIFIRMIMLYCICGHCGTDFYPDDNFAICGTDFYPDNNVVQYMQYWFLSGW